MSESMELTRLQERLGERLLAAQEEENGDLRLEVAPDALTEACLLLRDDPALACDYPADLTAYDTGENLVLWYRLYSMERNRTTILRVTLPREAPVIASVTPLWPGANWHERECYDLYGIRFEGHPNQHDPPRMRILLPKDWEGHPFRKDYVPVFSGDPLHGPQETN